MVFIGVTALLRYANGLTIPLCELNPSIHISLSHPHPTPPSSQSARATPQISSVVSGNALTHATGNPINSRTLAASGSLSNG